MVESRSPLQRVISTAIGCLLVLGIGTMLVTPPRIADSSSESLVREKTTTNIPDATIETRATPAPQRERENLGPKEDFTTSMPSGAKATIEIDHAKYQNCTIHSKPVTDVNATNNKPQPIWMPGIGAASDGPDDYAGKLLTMLTGGLPVRNYHSISRSVKRCHATDGSLTVACTTLHPLQGVSVNLKTFNRLTLVTTRNFAPAMYARSSHKANKYGHKEGAMPRDEWRSLRDQYIDKSYNEWKQLLIEWTHNLPQKYNYTVGAYLMEEHLADPMKGPEMVREVRGVLLKAGFAVVNDSDVDCIWYHIRQQHGAYIEEYFDSNTPYRLGLLTGSQRDSIASDMQGFANNESASQDNRLQKLLEEYQQKTLKERLDSMEG